MSRAGVKRRFAAGDESGRIGIPACFAALYFACMPLSIVPIPMEMSLLKLISLVIGGGLLVCLIVGDNTLKLNLVHLFWGLYLSYSVLSLMILHNDMAWETLRGLIETSVIFFLITTRVYNTRETKLIHAAWIIAGIITTVTLLVSGASADGDSRMSISLGGNVEDPNQLCGYFILPALLCIGYLLRRGGKAPVKLFFMVLLFGMIYVVFVTGSRGGLIAVAASVLVYVVWAVKGAGNRLKVLALLLVLAGLFFAVVWPMLPEEITGRLSVESVVEDQGSGRVTIWQECFEAATDSVQSIVFGNGLYSTGDILANAGIKNAVAHNHWLQVFCDQGAIGVALFFMVVASGMARNIKTEKVRTAAMFGMVALSMSLTVYAYYKPFWNVLMMTALNGADHINVKLLKENGENL